MSQEIIANFSIEEQPEITATFTIQTGGGIKDHNKLDNRDIPDQHPIGAITGLEEALNDKQNNLSQSQLNAVNSGITSEKVSAYDGYATSKQDVLSQTQQSAVDSGITSTKVGNYDSHIANKNNPHEVTKAQVGLGNVDNTSDLNKPISMATQTAISNETTNRQNADNSLQSQIDALIVSSDVFDIVGTYSELQAYDITKVPINDIIKVLVDSSHSNSATYYRCVEENNIKVWAYIGAEGAYYTKAESDGRFVPLTRTINNKPLSSDITLNASDVGALPSSTIIPSVNNATITIQKNSVTVDSFTANQDTNKTINITVPTTVAELSDNSDYMKKPTVTTITDTTYSLSIAENTIYEFSNAVTSLTISSAVKSYLESMIYFTTGSSITFTDNSTLKWGGGSVPTTLEANTTYCIAIKNGLAEIDKFGR